MPDDQILIECGKHGKNKAALVCGHLVNNTGPALGFIDNSSAPDDLQAWCYACEYLFEKENGMTDHFKEFNNMTVVRVDCYHRYKQKNSF